MECDATTCTRHRRKAPNVHVTLCLFPASCMWNALINGAEMVCVYADGSVMYLNGGTHCVLRGVTQGHTPLGSAGCCLLQWGCHKERGITEGAGHKYEQLQQ
jgi:hypothetical protein